MKAYQDVINKKVKNINPTIFRTFQGGGGDLQQQELTNSLVNPNRPQGFVQKIPDKIYKQEKRTSVFQKVDLSIIDFNRIPQNIKSEQELSEITPLLKDNFLTKNLTEDEINKLAVVMKKERFEQGDLIIRYGDIGYKYYVLSKGKVKVTVYNKGTDAQDPNIDQNIQVVKFLSSGVGFGELALLYNDKRSATIQCMEPCETYTLDGSIFKGMIIKSSIEKRSNKAKSLDQVRLFGKYTKA